jgi:hypothetical protein
MKNIPQENWDQNFWYQICHFAFNHRKAGFVFSMLSKAFE